ncbi:hypothetical protein GE09DRAFT_787147 [Coniochaeta sp. 2T2.1]|nr:hypothetical protein GE09DRAFT_787147 [Coniochaeta sp. 2T2.1]
MSSPEEIREQLQKVLQPYILPREEAAYRRRILAAHLQACMKDGSISSPLALVQPSRGVIIPTEARGLHRDYLKALNANISARAEYDKVRDDLSRGAKPVTRWPSSRTAADSQALNPLEEHLVKIKLQRKQARLQTVEKHISLLAQKPAASPSFLDPDEIFADTRPLPPVPREVVEAISLDSSASRADLTDLIDRLEKQVLRAKLLLKSEEKLLNNVKARSTVRPETVTDAAKLAALNTTRTELINWMEAELGKVPGDDESGDEDSDNRSAHQQDPADSPQSEEQLSAIRSRYAQYLSTRKRLLTLVSQPAATPVSSSLPPPTSTTSSQCSPPVPPPAQQPVTYLLTPHLTTLLSLSRQQKGLITQKSHLNTTITRQLRETGQLLDHLAEESNLLITHPLPGAAPSRRNNNRLPGVGSLSSETADIRTKVKPWVYAAEEAKLATLEAVAEKIEEGQVSLEGSMGFLMGVEGMLGRKEEKEGQKEGGEREEGEDSDIWLAEERSAVQGKKGRKHVGKQEREVKSDKLWAFLDGGLGGLKGEE